MCETVELPRRGTTRNVTLVANVRQIVPIAAKRGDAIIITSNTTLTEVSFLARPETAVPAQSGWCKFPIFPTGPVEYVCAEDTAGVELLSTAAAIVALWCEQDVPDFGIEKL